MVQKEQWLWAARTADVEQLKHLMQTCDFEAHVVNAYGRNALMLAANGGKIQAVRVLTKVCALEQQDFYGSSALHLASMGTDLECVQHLVQCAPHVANMQDEKGNTPLHLAAFYGHVQCVQTLIPYTDTTLLTHQGHNALMCAVKNGRLDCAKALAHVCAWDVKDNSGADVITLARQYRDDRLLTWVMQQVCEYEAQCLQEQLGPVPKKVHALSSGRL